LLSEASVFYYVDDMQTMVIPEEREGRLEDDPNLSREVTPANATVDTRRGGHPEQLQQHKVGLSHLSSSQSLTEIFGSR
jgi:hypothetical protein